jgi:hypothetical protein
MAIGKGQLYKVNSFDLGFINVTPVDIVLKIANIDRSTDELELVFVSAGVSSRMDTAAAIVKWFKEIYPSRSKENCLLKNARVFERFVDLKFAIPEPCMPECDPSPLQASMPADPDCNSLHKMAAPVKG